MAVSLLARVRAELDSLSSRARGGWRWYRGRKLWHRLALAALLLILIVGLFMLAGLGKKKDDAAASVRTVTLATVSELTGSGSSVDLIGTVRSISEANLLAQNGGTVRAVHARLGGYVPAGSVIAELENAAERASVLQAEGAYDAAIAARAGQSVPETQTSARNTYRTAFTTLDSTLKNSIDLNLFGAPTPFGPKLLLQADSDTSRALAVERARLKKVLESYSASLASADSRDPQSLLDETESIARQVATFLGSLSEAANERDSQATPTQLAAIATARASVDGVRASVSAARAGYRSGTVSATAGADASVKQALGVLRAAQANLERTVVRAPIAGQVNFLPIRIGDYVTPLMHVATVAQNGSLEIVAYISEDNRDLLAAGTKVKVEEKYDGVITSVAPALDPTTKQIEVHVAVTGASELVNGQSVRISLTDLIPVPSETAAEGPLLLPLASVKLRAEDRIVFTVGEDSRLVARTVEVGEVRGDRIEVLSGLTADLRIVTDARGLADGELVQTKTAASVR